MPAISFVMPVYNSEKYLRQCLDSVLSQSFKDFEIICINDGSRDSSLSILNEYAANDSRVKVYSQKNTGPALARNKGLDLAVGEYLWLIDSDDWIEKDSCAELYKIAREHTPDIVMFASSQVFESDTPTGRLLALDWPLEKLPGAMENTVTYALDHAAYLNTVALECWSRLYSRKFLNDNQLRFSDMFIFDDSLFNTKCMILNARLYCTKSKYYVYRIRSSQHSIVNSLFSSPKRHYLTVITLAREVDDLLAQRNLTTAQKQVFIERCLRRLFAIFGHSPKVTRHMYPYVRKYINSWDSSIITEDFLGKLGLKERVQHIRRVPCFVWSLISVSKKDRGEQAKLLGFLPLSEVTRYTDRTEHKYFGLFTIIKTGFSVKYYIFGLNVFRKNDDSARYFSIIEKRLNDIFFNMQALIQVPFVHQYFRTFKKCHEGREIVLLGTGPTVKHYKPIENAIHVGVNGSVRIFDRLDYLFVVDGNTRDKTLNSECDEYKGNNCKKFYGIMPQRRLLQLKDAGIARVPQHCFYNADAYTYIMEDIFTNKWAVNLEYEAFGDWGGTVFSALQFIAYTYPKRIYLAGCDVSSGYAYQSAFPNDYRYQHNTWKSFKVFMNRIYPNIEIISINPVGLKGLFTDTYTESYKNSLGGKS